MMMYDPAVVSYGQLCDTLLSTVDPTALNRVGNDLGAPAAGSAAPPRWTTRAARLARLAALEAPAAPYAPQPAAPAAWRLAVAAATQLPPPQG